MPELGDLAVRAGELTVRIGVAAAVITAFVVGARFTTPVFRRLLDRRRRPSYTRVFGALFRVVFIIVGFLFALTVAFPSVRVADVLAIFGIVSVAAGFAFKDTFENLLAGVLLLLRDPFKSGDQVTIAGREGTVEGVTVRETLLRAHDGRRYFIPNSKVMTDVIEVETHESVLRQSFALRFDAGTDFQLVRRIVVEALRGVQGVCPEPASDVVLVDVIDGDVEVQCRFWSGSRRREATAARDLAIDAVMRTLVTNEVPMPVGELRVAVTGDLDTRDGAAPAGERSVGR